ncbi:MAG: hypothetical protein COB22_07880 [Cycloclasticus sp.]|nr:MAG: hypothetical protein COB22_07880 [Cycloclasticus sp.]
MDNSTVEVVLRINAKQFEKGVKNATRVYASSTKSIAGVNTTASNSMGGLTNKVLALGAAYLTIGGSIRLLKTLLSTGGNFESLNVSLASVTGSAEAGEKAFEWINVFVKETPFGLEDVTKGFIKLKAFGLDPMDGTYQVIADQASALGGGQEKLNGIIIAVGQAWAKQKLQAEEILQMVERGVPVWDLLAKVTGKNAAELSKLSEAGKLGRDVIKKLLVEMGKGVHGASLEQVKTWNGLVSNAQVEWQKFLDLIATTGSLDFFKDELTDLLKEVERLAASGELEEYAQEVGDAIVGMARGLKSAGELIFSLSTAAEILIKVAVVVKLLAWAKALDIVTSKTRILTITTKILKGVLTLGGTVALDAAISYFLTYGDAAEDAARKVKKAADETSKALKNQRKVADDAIQDIVNDKLKKQAAIHQEFADKIKKAKQSETKAIKTELAAQLKAYDKHLKGLEDAKQRQVDIAKSFADLIRELNTGAGKEIEQPDILDFASAITNARKALSDGDYEGAIEGAEGLAEIIRTMRDNGTEADIVLQGLAQQAAKLANEAAGKRIEQEASALEKAQQSIDKLITRAEFLKHIELGFDQKLADKNLSDIQKILQQRLNGNPLVMSINLAQGVDLKQAEDLLKQTGVTPLIPNIPQLPDNTTPIIRPLQLDTSEAERQIDAITQKATQPVTKKIYVSEGGASFSDRPNGTAATFKEEAIGKGSR